MPSRSTSALASSASIRLEYGPAGLELAADAPVVEPEHPVPGGQEVVHLVGPGLQVVGQPVDQDDGLVPVAVQLVVDG